MKQIISDLNLTELEEEIVKAGQPKFRAGQIFKWVSFNKKFSEMTDIPLSLKELLSEKFYDEPVKIIKALKSVDGSEKYLYELSDGNIIEGVFLPNNYGNTLCVSTQIGCRMGCGFCASGLDGLIRNLSAGEIFSQVAAVNAYKGGNLQNRSLSNLVLMGSGEPLDNYDNVTKFLKLVTHEKGLNFSMRSISVSTCGLVDKIKMLADENYGVTLSVSLHATTDEARQEIMPIAKKYSVFELIEAVKYYFDKTGRRIIFEYSLIKDKNMNFYDAKRLAELTKGYPCHVNLIMLNYVKERGMAGCTKQEAERFLEKLTSLGVSATLRKSYGSDIGGACGQLRRKFGGCKPD